MIDGCCRKLSIPTMASSEEILQVQNDGVVRVLEDLGVSLGHDQFGILAAARRRPNGELTRRRARPAFVRKVAIFGYLYAGSALAFEDRDLGIYGRAGSRA